MQEIAVKPSTDSRHTRSVATKSALMRAAEKLVAEGGMENLSIKEIVAVAGTEECVRPPIPLSESDRAAGRNSYGAIPTGSGKARSKSCRNPQDFSQTFLAPALHAHG